MMKKLTIQLLLVFVAIYGVSQEGPGGVGETDGTSSLLLWLNADYTKQDSGIHVGLWLDQSGYSNHARPESGLGPTYSKDSSSKKGVLNFNRLWGDLLIVNNTPLMSPDEISLYVVGKISPKSEEWAGFVLKESGSQWENGYGIGRNADSTQLIGFTTDFNTNGVKASFEYDEWQLASLHHGMGSLEFYNQGKLMGYKPVNEAITKNSSTMWIGWTGSHLDGEIAEIIMYNKRNSVVERRLIENYLSTKYLLNGEEDLYPYEADGFVHDLVGFGKAEDGSEHVVSKGPGLVSIGSPSDLDNDEYLLWASCETGESEIIKSGLPDHISGCLHSVWRVSETNLAGEEADVGAVDLTFDLTELFTPDPEGIVLLIDADNDGSFTNDTPVEAANSNQLGEVTFKSVSGLAHGTHFTLGTTSQAAQIFEPILLWFKDEIIDSALYLNWKVSTMSDITAFLVDKAGKANDFIPVGSIGESDLDGKSMQFMIKDPNSRQGYSVYRLSVVGVDGDTTVMGHYGFDYNVAIQAYSIRVIEEERQKHSEEMAKSHKTIEKSRKQIIVERLVYISIGLLSIFIVIWYFRRRYSKAKKEKDLLLQQIDELKKKGVALSVTEPESRKDLELDKSKIEQTIDSKLGESAWMILNLIFENPSISNKDIAEEVSLSIEGVSSSLRRMYVSFDITTSSNMKIALIMKAARISSEG